MTEHLNSDAARLELNARGHRHDPGMDRVADLLDGGHYAEWSKLPPAVLSEATAYADLRANYRAAVAAGVIADDRSTPTTTQGA